MMNTQLHQDFEVRSPNVKYTSDKITSVYEYQRTEATVNNGKLVIEPITDTFHIETSRVVPKVGVMLVGLGGNNGSSFVAGQLANRDGVSWRTKRGIHRPNYYGSVCLSSTVKLAEGHYVPMNKMVPMSHPNDFVVGGWDISKMNLGDAMQRAGVLEWDLQRQLMETMSKIVPLPSIFDNDFIAANQKDRADNVLAGTKQEQMDSVRQHIRDFKKQNKLETVIVLWSANTERFTEIDPALHGTAESLLLAIRNGEKEIAPSTMFAVAAILENCAFINGSPQNTLVPGCVALAVKHKVFVGGDDFKTGQTKFKSALVEYLVGAGIKPVSITSYNHLGNNDGMNLSSAKQFRSKEISKASVVDDMVASNKILYKDNEHPDHTIVIKYVPYVGDSKRALDEYVSEIFLGGINTIAVHNTCEYSLLAVPVMYDLIIMTELAQRMKFKQIHHHQAQQQEKEKEKEGFETMHSVLSLLSFLLKAPMVPENSPLVNALNKQRACIENILRAAVGLPPENNMLLEYKMQEQGKTLVVEKNNNNNNNNNKK